MQIDVKDDIQPKAVMTAEEQARWDALPAEEQLLRLRAAIDVGIKSGVSPLSMDQIWSQLRTQHSDAQL